MMEKHGHEAKVVATLIMRTAYSFLGNFFFAPYGHPLIKKCHFQSSMANRDFNSLYPHNEN